MVTNLAPVAWIDSNCRGRSVKLQRHQLCFFAAGALVTQEKQAKLLSQPAGCANHQPAALNDGIHWFNKHNWWFCNSVIQNWENMEEVPSGNLQVCYRKRLMAHILRWFTWNNAWFCVVILNFQKVAGWDHYLWNHRWKTYSFYLAQTGTSTDRNTIVSILNSQKLPRIT